MPDAIVVGSGPNGLAAAIVLARAGVSVRVLEAADTVGGGARSAELTLPGFVHDVCSAIHPLGVASPFFRTLPLAEHGVEWIEPPAALAHPFDDGTAALLERSADAAVRDARRGRARAGGGSSRRSPAMPSRCSRTSSGRCTFPRTRSRSPASACGRLLRRRRSPGWRFAARRRAASSRASRPTRCCGSTARRARPSASCSGCSATRSAGRSRAAARSELSDALASYLRALGGEIETGQRVESLAELGDTRTVLLDVTPRGLLALAGDRLTGRYRRGLEHYRYGPGVFKLDWALDGPIPWRAEECARAATVHLGATLEEIAASEVAPGRGRDRGAALRPPRPAEPLRPDARAGRAAHGLGVLPRPERLDRRHDGADRGAGRALRPRLPRADPRPLGARPGGRRALQRELRRRRHQRRRRDPVAALHASRRPGLAVHDAATGRLPLLGVDAARRRRARDVRLPRGAGGTAVGSRATPTRTDRPARAARPPPRARPTSAAASP